MKKTKITFEKESDTVIKIFNDGKHIGNIWSQTDTTPFPHDESTLESIQICGFNSASEVWSCGVFHGKKDIVLNFKKNNYAPFEEREYKEYINECFKIHKPELIKSFEDWCSHMGHPSADVIRRIGYTEQCKK